MKNQTINPRESNFLKITLSFEENLFDGLLREVNFEEIVNGRVANQLLKVEDNKIPLVRTTTQYILPPHRFSSLHHKIIKSVNDTLENQPCINFNNALIEVYDANYKKMKYHSDQSLDLAPHSYIGLFSCYEKPDKMSEKDIRKLKIKDKVTQETFEISLTHNSFVLFSLETNARFTHKIVLEGVHAHMPQSKNRWLGITFRESMTFITFKKNIPYFLDGRPLQLATQEEAREYYKLRAEENRSLDFSYPSLSYTLSVADRMVPL